MFAAVGLVACASLPRIQPPDVPDKSIDSVTQFLLTSAATDFHSVRPSDPGRFRNVRLGHLMTPSGEKSYRLCGEFLAAEEGGDAAWTRFVTIKTSGYEQYNGPQAAAYCEIPSVKWDNGGDLSAALQKRLESLR